MRRGVFILLLFFLVVSFAQSARAQSCKEQIKLGLDHFSNFHQGRARFEAAEQSYQQAATDSLCAYEANWRLADLYLCYGTYNKDKSQKISLFKKGMVAAEKAVAIDPGKPEGHYQYSVNLGSIVEIDGVMKNILKVRKISKANEKALAADPNFVPAMVVKARFMTDLPKLFGGSPKQAEALYKKAIATGPDYETPYVEYADYLIDNHRPGEAKALLENLLDPGFNHHFAAPWLTIDLPRAKALVKKLQPPAVK